MNRSVWKIGLQPPGDITETMLPEGAEPLCVQLQGQQPCLWLEVDVDAAKERRRFFTVGTGHLLPTVGGAPEYLGTYQDGPFVWHVYEA